MFNKKKPDGGPVYPQTMDTAVGGEGLSLRDYFAGLALQSLVTATSSESSQSVAAMRAYEFADAMLIARREAAVTK